MKKVIFFLFAILFFSSLASGQKAKRDQLFDDAEFFFITREYEEALYLFLELLKEEPGNANFNYRTGMTYLNIPGREINAIPYFEKAVRNTSLEYRDKDLGEKKAPHHSWFYLGNAYRINNDLDKALEAYSNFMNIQKFEKNYNLRIVEDEIKAVERAKIIKDSPINILKENLGTAINDGSKNYIPVVNLNENTIVFMRSQKFYEAIMYSFKKDDLWVEAINITSMIGSDGDMVPSGLSADGKKLLLIKKSKNGTGDVYLSELQGNLWTKAEKLGKNINTPKNEDHASFSPDNSEIYFSSDRRGGLGGLDLYLSKLDADGNWGKAINLGPNINTPEDETSVFLNKDGSQLFFSSKAHYNMGGYDIFYTKMNVDGNWGDITNIGFPVNTTNDNGFFQPVAEGDCGYVSMFSEDQAFGSSDVFRLEILPYTDPRGINSPFKESFSLILRNNLNGEETEIIYDYNSGNFKAIAPDELNYSIYLKEEKDNY